jgi:hypothetical protein
VLQRSSTFSFLRLSRGVTYCGILLAALFFSPRAEASFILNFTQAGSDVIANGSGTINLSALTSKGACGFHAGVLPASGVAIAGNTGNLGLCDVYSGFSGPSNFGSGGSTAASAATGDTVGIEDILPGLFVPSGYLSGTSLSDTATWSNQTLSSLGMTPGAYTYSWGTGATADSLVVHIGAASAPEPGSLFLFGTGAILLALSRSKNQLLRFGCGAGDSFCVACLRRRVGRPQQPMACPTVFTVMPGGLY